ncbi:hypothetical protein EMIT0P253_300016 [Pseudomonas sp. IT-P253]
MPCPKAYWCARSISPSTCIAGITWLPTRKKPNARWSRPSATGSRPNSSRPAKPGKTPSDPPLARAYMHIGIDSSESTGRQFQPRHLVPLALAIPPVISALVLYFNAAIIPAPFSARTLRDAQHSAKHPAVGLRGLSAALLFRRQSPLPYPRKQNLITGHTTHLAGLVAVFAEPDAQSTADHGLLAGGRDVRRRRRADDFFAQGCGTG